MKSHPFDNELFTFFPADIMTHYSHWTIAQLKAELSKRKMKVSGRKAELIDR